MDIRNGPKRACGNQGHRAVSFIHWLPQLLLRLAAVRTVWGFPGTILPPHINRIPVAPSEEQVTLSLKGPAWSMWFARDSAGPFVAPTLRLVVVDTP